MTEIGLLTAPIVVDYSFAVQNETGNALSLRELLLAPEAVRARGRLFKAGTYGEDEHAALAASLEETLSQFNPPQPKESFEVIVQVSRFETLELPEQLLSYAAIDWCLVQEDRVLFAERFFFASDSMEASRPGLFTKSGAAIGVEKQWIYRQLTDWIARRAISLVIDPNLTVGRSEGIHISFAAVLNAQPEEIFVTQLHGTYGMVVPVTAERKTPAWLSAEANPPSVDWGTWLERRTGR